MVAFVEPEGWLVTRFLDGEVPPPERMGEPEMLRRVAQALRAFHEGPCASRRVRLVPRRRDLRETALDRGGVSRPRSRGRRRWRCGSKSSEAGATAVPCHNDLLNANFLDDGGHLWIVDWEYAGMGDRFFDLANFSINHELDADARGSCSGVLRRGALEDERALELMRFMSDFREAMWGVVQSAVSELDFDFRLRDGALRAARADRATPEFIAALEPRRARGASRRPSP